MGTQKRLNQHPIQAQKWLAERARFVGSLVGLTDEQFNEETAPGQWTYRAVAKHVPLLEQGALKTIAADQVAREPPSGC